MKTLESGKVRPKVVRFAVAAVLYVAVNTAIVGWSLPGDGRAGDRAGLAMRLTDAGIPEATDVRSTPMRMKGNARGGMSCADCGVIESVRSIDTREEMTGSCAGGDASGIRIPGEMIDNGERPDLATLADTIAGVMVGEQRVKKVRVTTRHQIVVRFRDGSRHVFNEETPRTLRVGDRIQVIAGAVGVNG
jgi:outer membrane lipoprotein SlyB